MSGYHTLRAANEARQAEWDTDNRITLSYRGNELGGECGEAQNVIKKLERERLGIRGSRDSVEHLAEELADVVICADLIAMSEGIDLDGAVRNKFNATSAKVGLYTRLVPVNWEGMIAALMMHVANCEGTDFLGGKGELVCAFDFADLTLAERAELGRLRDLARKMGGWPGYE